MNHEILHALNLNFLLVKDVIERFIVMIDGSIVKDEYEITLLI